MTDTVAILGAGSLGAVYASRFYDADPASISLVASGERYQRLKRDGLIVNRRHYAIPGKSQSDIVMGTAAKQTAANQDNGNSGDPRNLFRR